MPPELPSAAPGAARVYLILWRAARAVEARAVRSIEGTGLCASDFGVLEALLHKGPLAVNALGRKVLLTSGSITTAVDRLELRGLVARLAHPDDRRVRLVELTPAGRELISAADARHEADLEEVLAVLGDEERTTLVSLLRTLGRSAAGADQEPLDEHETPDASAGAPTTTSPAAAGDRAGLPRGEPWT
jgi:MarR family 2-MHQ and catechol resistance regulon transcriptional repressor